MLKERKSSLIKIIPDKAIRGKVESGNTTVIPVSGSRYELVTYQI
jgi:hypothetical protein